ncbi:MAG: archaellin/type IV pilin N-terminal domain-containing protein, partial [Nitrososphaerota archaeon]
MMVRRRAGISPVVATVILVAVAIVIAIAVAFWASGLVGIFTRFEKIEIQTAYWDGTQVIVIA